MMIWWLEISNLDFDPEQVRITQLDTALKDGVIIANVIKKYIKSH